jgi:hypothetical protein
MLREEDVEVADAEDRGDLLATYYADATKGADRFVYVSAYITEETVLNTTVFRT